jgi:predicted Fe-Mo cluster-binding NifX family protein
MVAPHFGRCDAYTIADIEDGKIVSRQRIANPGHAPGVLPGYLAERGVQCIIAGGMGPRAETLFRERNIETIVGVSGTIDETLDALKRGDLRAGASLCEHGEQPTSAEEA